MARRRTTTAASLLLSWRAMPPSSTPLAVRGLRHRMRGVELERRVHRLGRAVGDVRGGARAAEEAHDGIEPELSVREQVDAVVRRGHGDEVPASRAVGGSRARCMRLGLRHDDDDECRPAPRGRR